MVFTRTGVFKPIGVAQIQESWYHEGRIMGINMQVYTLYCRRGIDRPTACILARNMNIWVLPGFSSRDLVAVLINYNESETERRLVICSADLPYDSDDPPSSREFEELVFYYDEKNLNLLIKCNSFHTTWCGVAPTAIKQGWYCWNS
jgi:hypothetical protein